MVCSDMFDSSTACVRVPSKTARDAEDRLSALPPSLRGHVLNNLKRDKALLEKLATV